MTILIYLTELGGFSESVLLASACGTCVWVEQLSGSTQTGHVAVVVVVIVAHDNQQQHSTVLP